MSEVSFRIRLKIGDYAVELTGPHMDVMKTLEELPEIIGKIALAFNSSNSIGQSLERESTEVVQKFPTIVAEPGISCPEAIISLLSTGWGRKMPRYLGEIMEAMKVNALHFPIGTVKGRLTDLTKKGSLRRIRGEKGYGYIIVN